MTLANVNTSTPLTAQCVHTALYTPFLLQQLPGCVPQWMHNSLLQDFSFQGVLLQSCCSNCNPFLSKTLTLVVLLPALMRFSISCTCFFSGYCLWCGEQIKLYQALSRSFYSSHFYGVCGGGQIFSFFCIRNLRGGGLFWPNFCTSCYLHTKLYTLYEFW